MRILSLSSLRQKLSNAFRTRAKSAHRDADLAGTSPQHLSIACITPIAVSDHGVGTISGRSDAPSTPPNERTSGGAGPSSTSDVGTTSRAVVQTSISLLNLALPVAEIFTPLKVVIGVLLESAKLLDKRNSNLAIIKSIASRADDLLEALSTRPPAETMSVEAGSESHILVTISQTLKRRISDVIDKIQDLERKGIIHTESVFSALLDAKSELDECVQYAQVKLSAYQAQMMHALAQQVVLLRQETLSVVRLSSRQRSLEWGTISFFDMTGRETTLPYIVALVPENLASFLKQVFFSGSDTISTLHKTLLEDNNDRVGLYSTDGWPAKEGTQIYMKVKRKQKLLTYELQAAFVIKEEILLQQDPRRSLFFQSTSPMISEPENRDLFYNPLIQESHIMKIFPTWVRFQFKGTVTSSTDHVLRGGEGTYVSQHIRFDGHMWVMQNRFNIQSKLGDWIEDFPYNTYAGIHERLIIQVTNIHVDLVVNAAGQYTLRLSTSNADVATTRAQEFDFDIGYERSLKNVCGVRPLFALFADIGHYVESLDVPCGRRSMGVSLDELWPSITTPTY